ncbi:hypothetical protein PINS_up008815 [Pythium insidiosum]|nr:hypothetical protein PINS_up008815 [Pythium insidiosum]
MATKKKKMTMIMMTMVASASGRRRLSVRRTGSQVSSTISRGCRRFRCADCGTVVASRADVIAKSFFGRTGKAYLMNAMFNVRMGTPRNRYLMTGMHTICDVMCSTCDVVLGWQYIRAMELSQKYKEGKFIMERAIVHDDKEEETWQRQ